MYWACLAPWILTRRDSYFYHYLPSHLTAIVLVSGLCSSLYQVPRSWALTLAALVIAVSALYSPRWAGLPRRLPSAPQSSPAEASP